MPAAISWRVAVLTAAAESPSPAWISGADWSAGSQTIIHVMTLIIARGMPTSAKSAQFPEYVPPQCARPDRFVSRRRGRRVIALRSGCATTRTPFARTAWLPARTGGTPDAPAPRLGFRPGLRSAGAVPLAGRWLPGRAETAMTGWRPAWARPGSWWRTWGTPLPPGPGGSATAPARLAPGWLGPRRS